MKRLQFLCSFLLPALLFSSFSLSSATSASAQTYPTDDPVIKQMWELGVENSQTRELAHELVDVIGPRLAGSSNLLAAQDWMVQKYEDWGIPVRKEEYGTWQGWEAGILHVDMLEPRVSPIEAEIMAFSPGTDGPVTGQIAVPPADLSAENVNEWLGTLKGKFIMMSPPEAMCRASQELEANARPETVEKLQRERREMQGMWNARLSVIGSRRDRDAIIDSAGVAGVLTSRWSGGWGVNKVFSTSSKRAVAVDIGCEDYGLLYRLSQSGHTPTLRINAEMSFTGTVPQFNVVGQITGSEKPDEYVLLGAHLDSWHAGTGATDNGTGSITMLEAMRILRTAYPNPKRTILVGHWGPEEMGLIGSSAFREDHPEVMDGMQAAFNQDNGTWRFERLEGQGFLGSASHLPVWMAAVPTEISSHITVEVPGAQNNSGSDHSSFVCAQVPSFRLQSPYDEYRQYTWHTNRDTFDKIVFDDLAENATVAAMLAYMASEDPVKMDRTLANLPVSSRTGQARSWPRCRPARRSMN
jgi:carboxypeptidase Q